MGRRSSKSSHNPGVAPAFDTVGMTILPGVSLPEWAEPTMAEEPLETEPEMTPDTQTMQADQATQESAVAPQAPARASEQDWASAAATMAQEAQTAPTRPEPAYAMAATAAVAAATSAPGAYETPDPRFAEPSRYPSAPTYGQGWPASATPTTTATQSAAPGAAMAAYGAPAPTIPAPAGPPEYADAAPAGMAPQAMSPAEYGAPGSQTLTVPAPAAPAYPQARTPEATDPETPTSTWKSSERPELSPEHVALLTWWAEMIAAGQFPPPPGTDGPVEPAATPARRAIPRRAVAMVLAALVAVGLAVGVGLTLLGGSQPPVVPATEVTMPASVGDLVAMTEPQASESIQPLLGFGLRPKGVTVTGAYGTAAQGPLVLAAMATTVGAPSDAAGQIATWSQRTGSAVGEPIAGAGASQDVTCATAAETPSIPAGSFCVWSATGMRGQTYAVGMSAEEALALTAQVRDTTTGPAAPAA